MPVIYLDESGALNNKPKERYFVIGALVTEDDSHRRKLKNLYGRLFVEHCLPNGFEELHANVLSFPIKQDILKRLNKLGCFHLDYLVADKNHLIPSLFKEKNICYNYLVGRLVKKCILSYHESVTILIDNHSIKTTSLNSLKDYLLIEARTRWRFDWPIQVEMFNSKKCKGVQLVDVVSNAVFAKYNYNAEHLYNLCESNFRHRKKFPFEKFGK